MKQAKFLAICLPLLVGWGAALWTPLQLWFDMKEGLIAFLGFLAAALVQVMPVTANFLQSDKLTFAEAKRLTASLTRQQNYWVGLLTATLAAMVLVILGAALNSRAPTWKASFEHQLFTNISWEAVIVFFVASSVSFVMIKMLGLFNGMLSLHRLRVELVLINAKRAQTEKITALKSLAGEPAPFVSDNYGQVINPPQ